MRVHTINSNEKANIVSVSSAQLRRVNYIRYVLPFILFVIVGSFESWEHWTLDGTFDIDFHLTTEVLFFGVLGPTAVFVVFSYVITLLKKQLAISTELESLNQTLEQKVTERTETLATRNAELAQANNELQKLDQLKSDFVSLVSHELRGPLTTLNGGLEMALQETEHVPARSRRILEVMAHESQRLTNFVQTILDVSRLEAGKLALNPGLVAVPPLLHQTIDLVFAGEKRCIIRDIPPTLPPIWADEVYTEKIICNLLVNADKYSPAGQAIELSVNVDNDHLNITITDYGPGIPAEMQTRIFERFQRLESGDQITTQGWGLGLHFASVLAQAQRGQLTVKSPVHPSSTTPGSAFTLSIPIAHEDAPDA